MTALIQNFSIPAANDVDVTLSITPIMDLSASTIVWRAYAQAFGIPAVTALPSPSPSPPLTAVPLIEKSSADGSIIVQQSPPDVCQILINRSDTVDLLRNYYHETSLVDPAGNVSTLNCGIMTVTDTRNRP